jgi:hypothetical protein
MKSLASIEELGGIEPTALDMIDRSCQGICSVNYVTTDIAKFHGNYRILLAISSVDNTALPQLDVLTTPSIQYANLTYALGMDDYDFNQYVDDYYAELASKQPNASRRNPVQNPPGMFVLDAPLDSPEFAAAIYPLLRSDVTATRNFAYRTLRTKMVQEVKKEAMDQLQKLKSINPEQFVYPISISIQSYEYPAEADSQPRAMLRTREYKFDSAETFKRFLDKRIGDLESALH